MCIYIYIHMQRQKPDQSERVFDILVWKKTSPTFASTLLGSLDVLGEVFGASEKCSTSKLKHEKSNTSPRSSRGGPQELLEEALEI